MTSVGGDIDHFKVFKGDVKIEGDSLIARLFYPNNPEQLRGRLDENLSWGIRTLEQLTKEGGAVIADSDNPSKPLSGGGVYVTMDDVIIINRRDAGAPTHALYHETCAGYTHKKEHAYSAEGLLHTIKKELSEECLIFTNEKIPRLVVPNDAKELTIESARKTGINAKPIYVDVETLDNKDRIEIYSEKGEPIFKLGGLIIDMIWESQTSITAQHIRRLPFNADEIFPVDAEHMEKEGKRIWFNRESYLVPLSQIANLNFGDVLANPNVFRTKIDKWGIPSVYKPGYEKPYLGPDKIPVIDPHIFSPENLLCACLRGLDVLGYASVKRQLEIELQKTRTKVERVRDNSLKTKGFLPDKATIL